MLELPDGPAVTGPALVLVEQHHVERSGVCTAVVRRVRPLLEGRHLSVAHLVQDATGVLVTEVVQPAALPGAERAQGRRCKLGGERQRLEAREDAVPAEHRHEPGQAGGRQAGATGDGRREAERGHIDEAAPVRRLQRLPVALDPRRVLEPPPEILLHGHLRSALGRGHHAGSRVGAEDGDDVQLGLPGGLGLQPHRERQAVLVHLGRGRRRDGGLSPERLPLVAEHEASAGDPGVVLAFLLQRVLDLEQIREVATRIEANLEPYRLVAVIEDRQLFVEAAADGAPANHGQLRVDVDGARPGHEKEAGLEVLEVVDRERVEPLAVHRQHPGREEASVEREESGGIDRRCLDVPAIVADDERVAVEDLDLAHRGPLA